MRRRLLVAALVTAGTAVVVAALVGMEFNDSYDLTAIGTLALAAATFVSLYFARKTLAQTQRELELSRAEVEEAHRPVVVPVADRRSISFAGPGGGPARARPQVPEPDALIVPVENIGSGPALDIEASVRLLDSEGNLSAAVGSLPDRPAKLAGLAPNVVLPLDIRARGWQTSVSFELTLTYEDVARKVWTTAGSWLNERQRYEDVIIYPGRPVTT